MVVAGFALAHVFNKSTSSLDQSLYPYIIQGSCCCWESTFSEVGTKKYLKMVLRELQLLSVPLVQTKLKKKGGNFSTVVRPMNVCMCNLLIEMRDVCSDLVGWVEFLSS